VPDLFYFKLRQLETGEGTVIETTEGNIHLYIKQFLFIIN
jgi:hypothetical protein